MAVEEFVHSNPLLFIVGASFVLTVIITLVYKRFTNQQEMKFLKGELKELQGKVKEHRSDPTKLAEIQKEVASKNLQYMSHSLRPLIVTFLPLLLVFGWLRGMYSDVGALIVLPIVGWGLSWLWIYVLSSLIFSFTIRKILKVH